MHMNRMAAPAGFCRQEADIAPRSLAALGAQPSRDGFRALRHACAASGGIARADDLARLLDDCRRDDFVSLARLIGQRSIFAFDWRGVLWIPMFQFDLRDLSVRSAPQKVRAGLNPTNGGWTLAVWFAKPNGWLQGRRPVDLLDNRPEQVVRVAHVERFISALNPTHGLSDRRHP